MLKKIINIVLIVIIPLLAAFAVGLYGYNRYDGSYMVKTEKKGYYDTRMEDGNSESEILAYLDFYTTNYKEIYSQDIKNAAGKKLFTLKGYATYYQTYNDDGEVTDKALEYMFFAYNINYGNLYKEVYSTSNKEIGAFVPTLSVKFVDHENEDLYRSNTFSPISLVELIDHNWVGYTKEDGTETQKNSNNERITFSDSISTSTNQNKYFPNVKVATFTANKEYSENLDLIISTTDSEYSSYEASTVEVATINLTGVVQRAKNFDTTAEGVKTGYEEDIYEAGYFKYVFARYIWWEALIALVLTLVVTGATVIVWNVADDSDKKKNK